MDLETPIVNCKKCHVEFPINEIRNHLNQNSLCKQVYSKEDSDKLNELCDSYRKKRRAANYKNRQKQLKKHHKSSSDDVSRVDSDSKVKFLFHNIQTVFRNYKR